MLPHQFERLLKRERIPSVFAGAGLSYGLVPLPDQLLSERRALAEAELELPHEADEFDLYSWAEWVLAQLTGQDGVPPAKLRLAKALGLLSEPSWAGDVSYPAKGTAPRHRVLARFARESLWLSIWSWNWDCILERALEAIGFERGPPIQNQPWKTRYASVVVQEDFSRLGDQNLLCVLKPHGCVEAVAEAQLAWNQGDPERSATLADRFMIGATELAQERANQTDELFFIRMRTFLSSDPALIVGWSVSEPYLRKVIDEALSRLIKKSAMEELSIIDVHFNDEGHAHVAECYGLSKEQVFVEVSGQPPGLTADEFFLWLQCRLAILKMAEASIDVPIQQQVLAKLAGLEGANRKNMLDWADCFLPTWCRLCWRANVVPCAGFQPHQLALEKAEEYIPLIMVGVIRPDLSAAARLFASLVDTDAWDFATFPGALWRKSDQRLVVPLPLWGSLNDLAAIAPMLHQMPLGLIDTVDVLPMVSEIGQVEPSVSALLRLRLQLSRAMTIPNFAIVENIGVATDLM